MNPADRWNPGWQQFMAHQRAQAGGNRQFQPQQGRQANENGQQPRRNNAQPQNLNQNQNRRNQNRPPTRRDNRRDPMRDILTREELERIEVLARKNYQTRTALEYDNREDLCWTSILNEIEHKSTHFSNQHSNFPCPNGGPDILIPNEENIGSMLRNENQRETIMAARELLFDFGATEQELNEALANLEVHLRTNELEYNAIEKLSGELIETAQTLTNEVNELDDILGRIGKIRLQQ